jgi:hypothetical protein
MNRKSGFVFAVKMVFTLYPDEAAKKGIQA